MAGSVNKVILVGNLGKDPEIRRTQDGRPIANLRIVTGPQVITRYNNYRSITEALRGAGLKASPETIRRYVQRITRTESTPDGTAKTRRSQPTLTPSVNRDVPKKRFGSPDL